MDSLIPLVFIAICVAMIWWSYQQGRAGAVSFQANRAPTDVVMSAVQTFSQRGWVTTSQSPQSISFSKQQAPGCLITFFLLLFGIIPGLLFWIAAKRTLTVSVTAQPRGQAGSLVAVGWSRNGGGRGPSLEFKNLLAPGAPIAVAEVRPQGVLTSGVEEFTGVVSGSELRRQPMLQAPPEPWIASTRIAASATAAAPGSAAAPVAAARPSEAPTAPAVTSTPKFCPYCGTRIEIAGQRFCGSCGQQVAR